MGVPLIEAVRHATLDELIAETLGTGEAMRSELSVTDSRTHGERHIEVSAVPIKKADDEMSGAVVLFSRYYRVEAVGPNPARICRECFARAANAVVDFTRLHRDVA